MYLESQAINLNVYLYAGPVFTTRIRPIVYMEETSWDYKLGNETTDSFFSGHISMAAGASFFMAKVLSDYHPEWGKKRWLLYAGALIPPAIVGYYRYRGFMHFPTDLMVGLAVGTAVGITVPHLHKMTRKKNKNLSIVPFTGPATGVLFSMQF
jgi:membrane-associated phospholipid phosphatase